MHMTLGVGNMLTLDSFEKHTIRGLTKMDTRCCLALVVMLANGCGANQGQPGREDAKPRAGRLSGATQSAKSR